MLLLPPTDSPVARIWRQHYATGSIGWKKGNLASSLFLLCVASGGHGARCSRRCNGSSVTQDMSRCGNVLTCLRTVELKEWSPVLLHDSADPAGGSRRFEAPFSGATATFRGHRLTRFRLQCRFAVTA